MKKIGSSFPVFNQDSGNLVRTAVFLVVVLTALALPALGQEARGNLTVMTYNVNEGTDFLQVVGATNAIQFLLGVGDIVTQVEGTLPPERMQAVAAQILAAHPTLVSLQEFAQWYLGHSTPLQASAARCPFSTTCRRSLRMLWLHRADIIRSQ